MKRHLQRSRHHYMPEKKGGSPCSRERLLLSHDVHTKTLQSMLKTTTYPQAAQKQQSVRKKSWSRSQKNLLPRMTNLISSRFLSVADYFCCTWKLQILSDYLFLFFCVLLVFVVRSVPRISTKNGNVQTSENRGSNFVHSKISIFVTHMERFYAHPLVTCCKQEAVSFLNVIQKVHLRMFIHFRSAGNSNAMLDF